MSEPLNANPTVIDTGNLPMRSSKDQPKDLFECNNRIKKLLSLSLLNEDEEETSAEEVPEMESDIGMSSSEDESMEECINREEEDEIDSQEIFDLVSSISDPEHPYTLAQLAVINLSDIVVTNEPKDRISEVLIKITPTITHCSLATLIGLGIRVRLERCLPARFRIRIVIKEGTHQSENQVNKQLNDKERVAAACENDQLLNVIQQMLSTCK